MNFAELERTPHKRRVTAALLGLLLVVALTPASPLAVDNPIVIENQQPGSGNWMWSKLADHGYTDSPTDRRPGKSLSGSTSYAANPRSGTTAAVKLSFDRPEADSGLGNFYKWEMNFLRRIERSGYDATHSTDIDTHGSSA